MVSEAPTEPLICPKCAKVIDGEPNFCPACGVDLRGITPTAQTLSGQMSNTVVDERYRILEKLGEGGMGAVYKVEHVRMGKLLALKLLKSDLAVDKGLKARFMREARVVSKLSHQNTVQVFDSGELPDGSLYIAMEYLPGRDLAWHLRARGPMNEERAISVAIQVLGSLEEAHAKGIVHRDIKPANIMLLRKKGGDDAVKLLDFGIAKLQEAEGRKSITGGSDMIGTPSYMSPEQCRGDEADLRCDIYSLGAVLFELVSGKPPFEGSNPMKVVNMHLTVPPPRLTEIAPERPVSPAFEAVVRRAMSKDKTERFQNADQMRAALEKVRRELGGLPADFTPLPEELTERMASREDFDSFERKLKLQRTLAPVALSLVIIAVVLGGWAYQRAQKLPDSYASEQEPNDDLKQATPIALGHEVKGFIGAPRAENKGDRDLYKLEVPGGPVRVRLTGIDDLNLSVEVLQDTPEGAAKRRLWLDDVGVSNGEEVSGLSTSSGKLYLRIEERAFYAEAPRPSRERSTVPYLLKVESLAPNGRCEKEPNDSLNTAQDVSVDKVILAWTGLQAEWPERGVFPRPEAPLSAWDYFRFESKDETAKVAVLVVPPEKGRLLVLEAGGDDPKVRPLFAEDGRPELLFLNAPGTRKAVRIQSVAPVPPGAEYRIAFLSGEPGGLTPAVDLANLVSPQQRTRVLELSANAFQSSAQAVDVRALLNK